MLTLKRFAACSKPAIVMRHLYTEEEIESLAERRMDRLDEQLMTDRLTQEQYDAQVRELNAEIEKLYRHAGFNV